MLMTTDDFIYSRGIEEIKPMTLNMTLHKRPGSVVVEFRKKVIINLSDAVFWTEFFSRSLEGKPIKANVMVVFRDAFGSACKLKELGLLKPETKIKED